MRRWWPVLCLGLAACIAALLEFAQPGVDGLLERAQRASARRDWEQTENLARRATERAPTMAEAWLLLARASWERRQLNEAVEAWSRVPAESPRAAEARRLAGETCLRELRQPGRAEQLFREAIELDPDEPRFVDGLAQTLAVSGCWYELAPQLLRLIQLDGCTNFHLDLLARGKELNVDPQLLPEADSAVATDLLGQCARLRWLLDRGDWETVRERLPEIADSHPQFLPAQRLLGRLWWLAGDDDRLADWLQAASPAVRRDPDYWSTALAACQRWNDDAGAGHAALELLTLDPNDVAACLVLGRELNRPDEQELAAAFLQRAAQLERYAAAVSRARRAQDWLAVRQVVELAEELGFTWEAYGWCRLSSRLNPRLDWAPAALKRLAAQVSNLPAVRTNPAFQLAERIAADRFPPPNFERRSNRHRTVEDHLRYRPVTFQDDAAAAGLEFQYHNGGTWRDGLRRMFEFTGGGVGVLDFDGDGFPDLYLPQGGNFDHRGRPMELRDQLWRNTAGANWRNVTDDAGLADDGFGQGAAVGDLDNDGFPDLLVLNIGANVAWRNNGDGTFRRWTEFERHAGDAWSLSAAIADLDDDGTPDVYVVNYLAGDDLFTRICPDDRGVPRYTCQPLVFDAASDQLLRSVGDGAFDDVTASSGVDLPEGRGMGVVAGRFTQNTLDIYVANDATANFHFVRNSTARDSTSRPTFADEAFLRGTAVDAAGRAQASMGIAAGDANADGRTDLFLTNFEGEVNALYLQQSDGQFSDRSQDFGLASASRSLLGFGTQFLDVDLDGFPDLFVANGHVNDRRPGGGQFQMRPQVFRNLAGRSFREASASEAGPYFAGECLGRGAAVLDWNRDGRPDLAVSHLDRPAALLTNRTRSLGRWVKLKCVGTAAARDAIGTQVRVVGGNRGGAVQLTAGDGYESSNERWLCLGLGAWPEPEVALEVRWPGVAGPQQFRVPVDRETVIIEGRSSAWPLPPVEHSNALPP